MSTAPKQRFSNQLQNRDVSKSVHKFHEIKENQKPSTDDTVMLQGFAYNKFEADRLHFVNISTKTGNVNPLNTLHLGIDLKQNKKTMTTDNQVFLMDGIAALNPSAGEMLTVYHSGGTMYDGAREIMVFFTANGTVEVTLPLQHFDNVTIMALTYVRPRTYVSFGIEEDKQNPGKLSKYIKG